MGGSRKSKFEIICDCERRNDQSEWDTDADGQAALRWRRICDSSRRRKGTTGHGHGRRRRGRGRGSGSGSRADQLAAAVTRRYAYRSPCPCRIASSFNGTRRDETRRDGATGEGRVRTGTSRGRGVRPVGLARQSKRKNYVRRTGYCYCYCYCYWYW